MKEFITLKKEDFITWADATFGKDNYKTTTPINGRELVICHDTKIHGLEYHIYTTLEPSDNATRPIGEDAIRIILFDRFSAMIVHQTTKVLRVKGDTSIEDRLTNRINILNTLVQSMKENDLFCNCPQDRVHKVKRRNGTTGETFYGCSLFKKCHKNSEFKRKKLSYVASEYPLKDTPFTNIEESVEEDEKPYEILMKNKNLQKVSEDFKKWEVTEDAELWETKEWPYVTYPFKNFNLVQSTVLDSEVWNKDCNLVLGTATSSGKTICAELIIANIIYN